MLPVRVRNDDSHHLGNVPPMFEAGVRVGIDHERERVLAILFTDRVLPVTRRELLDTLRERIVSEA
jgi:hypothetical protein